MINSVLDSVRKLASKNSGDNDSDDTITKHQISDDLAEKKCKEIRTIFSELTTLCRQHKLKPQHRTEIINRQIELATCVSELVTPDHQWPIEYQPHDKNPALKELANIFEAAQNHVQRQYVTKSKLVTITEQIQTHAQAIDNEIQQHPEFDFAYSEKYREEEKGREIRSFGIPDAVDKANLEDGETPVEPYACGDAREAMEEYAHPDLPLWKGIGTRRGDDVSLKKDLLERHQVIFGKTGYGKSTMLVNDTIQLIRSGAGICFIDPKGPDSLRLLQLIPEDRQDDVVWVEPSASGDHISGFNYITIGMSPDNPDYEVARANLIDDIQKMLKYTSEGWGARMDRVSKNVLGAMNRYNNRTPDDAPELNLVDLYYILFSEASRKEFAARCRKADIYFVQDYLDEIAEMPDGDLEPLKGRFQPWVESPTARRMIGFRNGGINIPQAVDNDKIIIVRMGQEPRDLKQMLGMAVIRRIWSHIRSRADEAEYDINPFYLFCDEFDNIALRDETIPAVISESRSMRLSLNLATQYPSQLPEGVTDAITSQCDTIISFNPGDKKQAQAYSTRMKKSPEDLTDTANFYAWARFTLDNNEKSDPFKMYAYPPDAPRRPRGEAKAWRDAALEQFGREKKSDKETYKNLLFNGRATGRWETGIGAQIEAATEPEDIAHWERELDNEVPPPQSPAIRSESEDRPGEFGSTNTTGGDGDTHGIGSGSGSGSSGDPIEDHHDTILEAIFATALQEKGDPKAPVPTGAVEERLVDLLPEDVGTSLSEVSNIFERMNEQYVKRERLSGEVQVRLTTPGEAKMFDVDTGSAGSGGGDDHRWVLRQSYMAFKRIGYETWLPEQEGDEQPDGVADAPIDISGVDPTLSQSDYLEAVEERKRRLQNQYPAVWNLSKGDDLAIEAETSTLNKPFQTFNNLKKAQSQGSICVFAVKDESQGKGDFDYWAKRAERVIYKSHYEGRSRVISDYQPTFRKAAPNKGDYPRFYNYASGTYDLDAEKTALRPITEGSRSVWYHDTDTGEVVCAPSNQQVILDDEPHIRFDSPEAVAEGDPTVVPAYYTYDNSEQQYIVNNNGKELKYPTREEMEAEWETFKGPFIPENEFDEGIPEDDDFLIVIFPDSDNPDYDQPQLYDHGECKPLFDELGIDATLTVDDSLKHVDTDTDTDTDSDTDTEGDSENVTEPAATEQTVDGTTGDPDSTPEPDDEPGEASGAGGENNTDSSPPTEDGEVETDDEVPPKARVTPTEIVESQVHNREIITREEINTIATGFLVTEWPTEQLNHLQECIPKINPEAEPYADDILNLDSLIGNPHGEPSTEDTITEAEQDPTHTEQATPVQAAKTDGGDTGGHDPDQQHEQEQEREQEQEHVDPDEPMSDPNTNTDTDTSTDTDADTDSAEADELREELHQRDEKINELQAKVDMLLKVAEETDIDLPAELTGHNDTEQQPEDGTQNDNTVANESEAPDSVDTETNGADTTAASSSPTIDAAQGGSQQSHTDQDHSTGNDRPEQQPGNEPTTQAETEPATNGHSTPTADDTGSPEDTSTVDTAPENDSKPEGNPPGEGSDPDPTPEPRPDVAPEDESQSKGDSQDESDPELEPDSSDPNIDEHSAPDSNTISESNDDNQDQRTDSNDDLSQFL